MYETALANLTSGASVSGVVSALNSTFAKMLLDPQQKHFRQLLADTYLATINYNNLQGLNGTADQVRVGEDQHMYLYSSGRVTKPLRAAAFLTSWLPGGGQTHHLAVHRRRDQGDRWPFPTRPSSSHI